MSDDISIPQTGQMQGRAAFTHSYRTRRTGLDQGTRRLLMAAGALSLLLVGGMGTWAVMGRRPATVPVIEADSRPLRVKPENPGGMQVAGADEQIMGGAGRDGADAMAPVAEAPAPQALRAQMNLPAGPAPAAPASAPTAAPLVANPAPGVSPLPDTPAVAPRGAARTAAAPSATAPLARAPATGGTLVQLAAVDNEQAAQTEWQRLAKRMPELLGDRRAVVQKADRDGHAVWRVRTGGFADVAEATGFCSRVRAKGGACSIASF